MTDEKVYNQKSDNPKWIRPWEITKFDDMSNKDERFFSLVIKGMLTYLTKHIKLYNKEIKHFILTTGSDYLYVEQNDYEYSANTTSGETTLYSHLPRCNVEVGDFLVIRDELSAPYSRGYYERPDEYGNVKAYSAEIKRLPLEITVDLRYSLSNFNESIILIEELFNKLIWQRYYNINYLGQLILCSIEFPDSAKVSLNKIDYGSASNNNKTIELNLKIRTNYPIINLRTEVDASHVIEKLHLDVNPHQQMKKILDEDNTAIEDIFENN